MQSRGLLKGLDFFFVKDRPQGLPQGTINCQQPTANCHQPPTAYRRQPPAAANRHPLPTAIDHQSPTTNRRQPPPTATNRQSPTTNHRVTRCDGTVRIPSSRPQGLGPMLPTWGGWFGGCQAPTPASNPAASPLPCDTLLAQLPLTAAVGVILCIRAVLNGEKKCSLHILPKTPACTPCQGCRVLDIFLPNSQSPPITDSPFVGLVRHRN